jgi:thiol-disulfide isomerase/thioredoxin
MEQPSTLLADAQPENHFGRARGENRVVTARIRCYQFSMFRLLLICVFVSAACATRAGEFPDAWTWTDAPAGQAPRVHESKPMPPLKLTGWLNGKVTPDAMKGKVVMIDFFTTWCVTCIEDIPHNNELFEKYKEKGLVMIGVCTSNQGLENMPNLVREHKMKYPAALDPKLDALKAWDVSMYPTYALIDRRGIVRIISLKPEYLETVIQKLLAEGT